MSLCSRNTYAQLIKFTDVFRMNVHTKNATLILIFRSSNVVMKNKGASVHLLSL